MSNKVSIVLAVCLAFCVGSLSADECIACTSATDSNCATNPQILTPLKCNTPSGISGPPKCYARVVNGVTYRGCFAELDEAVRNNCLSDSMGVNCTVCENVNGARGCNNFIFPLNRLRCHTCSESGMNGNCFSRVLDAM